MKNRFLMIFIALWFLSQFNVQGSPLPKMDVDAQRKVLNFLKNQSLSDPAIATSSLILTKSCWSISFDKTIPSSTGGDVSNGKLLPPEIIAANSSSSSDITVEGPKLLPALCKGPNPIIVSSEDANSYGVLISVLPALVECDSPDALPKYLTSLREARSPSVGDLVVFKIILLLDRAKEPFVKLTNQQMDSWIILAKSENSIHRFIAAQMFAKLVTSHDDWASFYSSFSQETDPVIAKCAVETIAQTHDKKFLSTLQRLLDGQSKLGNLILVQYIQSLISGLKDQSR